ncbi:hypothetical protein [uncultured Metabacillus sp.]|uniref:hypothetical protein n=1 Tax=uncultured Metabacillus sp. TaxID=2860135 RepID=UPI002636ABC7|nr:hypothetical protein [uncultured Metabacillus sp.]
MAKNNLSIFDIPQDKRKKSLLENEYLNLPDLSFYNRCKQQFHINKGVYNTIDNWFYEYGIIHVVYRRIYILAFLGFVKENSPELDPHKFIRFGHGGLTMKLKEFTSAYFRYKENGYTDIFSIK